MLLLLLSGGAVRSYGQTPLLDSLQGELRRPQPDTTRILLRCEVAWERKFEEPEAARHDLQDALCMAREIGFLKGEATALNYFGVLENIHGRLPDAVRYFERALVIREQLGDQRGVASIHNNLGNIYVRLGNNLQALQQYQSSLKTVELLGDTARIARANYSLALAYSAVGSYPEALNHLYDYLWYAESLRDSSEMANAYNLIGGIKAEIELNDEAIAFYEKARLIRERLDDPAGLASTYNNLGVSESGLGEKAAEAKAPDTALIHYRRALDWFERARELSAGMQDASGVATSVFNTGVTWKNIGSVHDKAGRPVEAAAAWQTALDQLREAREVRSAIGEQAGLVEVLNALGDVYRRQGDYTRALDFTRQYMALAEQTGQSKFLRNGWKDLSRIYALRRQWEEAYEARKRYDELRWEDFNEKRVEEYARREVQYSDLKKQVRLEKQEQELALQEARLRAARLRQQALLGGGLALLLLALLLYNRYRIKTRANLALAEKNTIIEAERRKSDQLLLNILPEATAAELKESGRAAARAYEEVTVLFTDFVGFTDIASRLSASALVEELDTCFRAFDRITAAEGLEKIKTIGDAYLCVGGLPNPLPDHAAAAVRAARAMQDWMSERRSTLEAQGRPAFRMRVGLHTGPVVAGVVGDRKFAYDIWGDTVNTAARMESAGEPDRINISSATRGHLPEGFVCTPRGSVQVKGKGEMEMFWV